MKTNKTRVGIIGIRGYKVIYSGFETFVRNLIKKSDKAFFYFLFSRAGYQENIVKGKNFKNIIIPIIPGKYLETPIYAFFSTLYSLFLPLESILYLSVANTPFIWLQKLRERRVIVNVDGLDWKRARWSSWGKVYLKLCEYICIKFSDEIVTDSRSVFNYYKKAHQLRNIHHIVYGAHVTKRGPTVLLKEFDLKPKGYFLFVGRFVPENKVEDVILAFKNLKTDYKCVIVGDSFFEDVYKQRLEHLAGGDKRIVFTGILGGEAYEEVLSNSFAYIEPKEVGGIHPSLLEAMAVGNTIVAKSLPEHKETLSDSGLYYDVKNPSTSLKRKMSFLIRNPKIAEKLRGLAERRARRYFSWKPIIVKYQKLFSKYDDSG